MKEGKEEQSVYEQIQLSADDFISTFSKVKEPKGSVIAVLMIKKNMKETQNSARNHAGDCFQLFPLSGEYPMNLFSETLPL